MHGNLMYEMAQRRIAEQQRAARLAREAREARSAGRRRRAREKAQETVAGPAIPGFAHEMLTAAREVTPEPRQEAADGRHARSGG
jgi:hypothetical protein